MNEPSDTEALIEPHHLKNQIQAFFVWQNLFENEVWSRIGKLLNAVRSVRIWRAPLQGAPRNERQKDTLFRMRGSLNTDRCIPTIPR